MDRDSAEGMTGAGIGGDNLVFSAPALEDALHEDEDYFIIVCI